MKKVIKVFFIQNRFFLIFVFFWMISFSFLRTVQHYSFETNAFDLSIFDYAMYYTSKGELMPEPFHRYWGSHFAIHFTPILFFMVPFYFSVTMGFIIPYFRNQLGLKGSFEYFALKDCKIVKKYINSIPPDAPVASLSALIPLTSPKGKISTCCLRWTRPNILSLIPE
jgi:hypothetical protein